MAGQLPIAGYVFPDERGYRLVGDMTREDLIEALMEEVDPLSPLRKLPQTREALIEALTDISNQRYARFVRKSHERQPAIF